MKSHINLYQARFAPKVDYLSLSSVLLVLIVCVALVVVAGLTARVLAERTEKRYLALVDRNMTLQTQIDNFQLQLTNWKPDPLLQQNVEAIKLDLAFQEQVFDALSLRAPLRDKGLSILLDDLATFSEADLWLQTLLVSETRIDFSGEMSSPDAFPRWLHRLSNSRSLSGRDFEAARVYLQDNALKFELMTQRTANGTGHPDAPVSSSLETAR